MGAQGDKVGAQGDKVGVQGDDGGVAEVTVVGKYGSQASVRR